MVDETVQALKRTCNWLLFFSFGKFYFFVEDL